MGNQNSLREKTNPLSYPNIAGCQKQIFHLNKGFEPSLNRTISRILREKKRQSLKSIIINKEWTSLGKIISETLLSIFSEETVTQKCCVRELVPEK